MTDTVTREEFNALNEKVALLAKSNKMGKEKKKRAPSEYNIFFGKELKRIKKENPQIDHKTAFSKAAEAWKKQKTTA